MKLAKHIRRLIVVNGYRETIIARPKEVREVLFLYHVTPTLKQVKRAIHKHTEYILYGKVLGCECGNSRPHDFAACAESINGQRQGDIPDYHCEACQFYGDDRYADANGVVWIGGLTACEFKRRLVERTRREDARMRRDLAYIYAG